MAINLETPAGIRPTKAINDLIKYQLSNFNADGQESELFLCLLMLGSYAHILGRKSDEQFFNALTERHMNRNKGGSGNEKTNAE